MVQSQTTWKRRLTHLVKMSKFVFLSCLLWRLSVPFFSTNGKYKACSFAWAVELSSSFVMKLKQLCGSYPFSPFFVIFGEFEVFFCALWLIPILTYCGQVLGECLVKFICFQSRICSLYNLWSDHTPLGAMWCLSLGQTPIPCLYTCTPRMYTLGRIAPLLSVGLMETHIVSKRTLGIKWQA